DPAAGPFDRLDDRRGAAARGNLDEEPVERGTPATQPAIRDLAERAEREERAERGDERAGPGAGARGQSDRSDKPEPTGRRPAAPWAAATSPIPAAARSSSSSRVSRANGSRSAVACTSTRRPSPVITTFMSVSALESSE